MIYRFISGKKRDFISEASVYVLEADSLEGYDNLDQLEKMKMDIAYLWHKK